MDYKEAFRQIFAMPDFPRVRANDPLTSFEAAESIKPVVAAHHQVILDCLLMHGALGKDGIAALTNLDGNQVARRLNEMKVLGLIELTGNTVKSNSGRNEREWKAFSLSQKEPSISLQQSVAPTGKNYVQTDN